MSSALTELERRQGLLAIDDDLTPYAGQWVAVRDRRVVAHDVDPARLAANENVEPTDMILAVGDPASRYYVL